MRASDVEALLDDRMGTGIYQMGVLSMGFLFSFVSTDSFAINFIAGKMDHTCSEAVSLHEDPLNSSHRLLHPGNGTFLMRKCDAVLLDASEPPKSLPCSRWAYDKSEFLSSIVSEFDLVCRHGWLVDLVSTFYMAGRLLACLSHGYFSDRYGRKKVLIGSHALKLIGGVMSIYSGDYLTFAISRFVIAVGSTASCMASFVLLVECAGSRWRRRFGILFNISPAVGGMILPLVAFLVRDFRGVQAIYTWPQFILCFCYFILDESPKWLVSQGREDETLKVMRKMAIINDRVARFEDFLDKTKSLEKITLLESDKNTSSDKDLSIFHGMFGSRILTAKTLILWMCWFVAALIYYAISLNTGRLPGSIYLNTFLLTIVEIPANMVTILVVEKFGGRITLGIFTCLAGASSFAMMPFMLYGEFDFVVTALGILGKGLITVTYNALYVETAETYQTKVRSQAMGIAASFGRLSSMASSFLGGFMADVWKPLPSLIFGSLALMSGLLFVIFPSVNTGDMSAIDRNSEKNVVANEKGTNDQSLA